VGSARTTLTDGTRLVVGYAGGGVQLPAGVAPALSEADLATCDACGRIDPLPNGAQRVRVTTASESGGIVGEGGLFFAHDGSTRKVRWDVVVLP
jgi:hypothetical protein